MKNNFLILILVVLILQSCEENPVRVFSKPIVTIIKPVANTNIPDSVTIVVDASDNKKIIRLEIFIDHNMTMSFEKPPYEYLWETNYLPDGSQHIINAVAYDDEGNETKSKPVIVNVFRFMPSSLFAMLNSDSTIMLQWTDNCSFETGFEIEQAINDTIFTKIADIDSNTTSFIVKGNFNKLDQYYFKVRAKSPNSLSGYSNVALAYIVLLEPTNLSLIFTSDTSATLSWEDNSSFETSFIIQQQINSSYISIMELPSNTLSAEISGNFYNDIFYHFRVGAVSEYTTSFSPSISQQFKFNSPRNLSINNVSIDKLRLEWESGNNFETAYKIERSINSSQFSEIATTNVGELNFVDLTVDTSNEYSYRIKAISSINVSLPSIIIKALFVPFLSFNRNIQAPSPISAYDINDESDLIVMGGYLGLGLANYIIDVKTGSVLKILYPADSMDQSFNNIGINSDESIIGAGSYDDYITLWSVADGSIKGRLFTGFPSQCLLFHNTKNILIVAANGIIFIWDYITGTQLHRISSSHYIYSIAISTNGDFLAVGGSENDIKIIDINSGTIIKTIPSSATNYNLIFFDDNSIITSKSNEIRIWDINSGIFSAYTSNYGAIEYLTLHPDKRYLVGVCSFGIIIFDVIKEKVVNIDTDININQRIRLQFINQKEELISHGIRDFYILNFEYRWQVPIN
jgi:WD40 repeat protein